MKKVKMPIKRSILGLLLLCASISRFVHRVPKVGLLFLALAIVCGASAYFKYRKYRAYKAEQTAMEAEKAERMRKIDEEHAEWMRKFEEEKRARDESLEAARAAREAKAAEFKAELTAIPRARILGKASTDSIACPEFTGEFKTTNITSRTNIEKIFPLVVLDLETTGLNRTEDEIIEVGAVKFGPGFEPISRYHIRCKSRVPIPERITQINGITNEMVKDMPYFSQIAGSFEEYISGCSLCGHNAAKFDLPFLVNNGVNVAPGTQIYDTWVLGSYIFETRQGLTLDNLCAHFKIFRPKAHNAIYDAYAASKILQEFIKIKT